MTNKIILLRQTDDNTSVSPKYIYIPNEIRKYRLQAVASGGPGGGSSGVVGNKSGGGGGAGDFIDFQIELEPKTLIQINFQVTATPLGFGVTGNYIDINIGFKPLNAPYQYVFLKSGQAGAEGGSTTPGKGGDSGGGGEGGTYSSTADPNNFPTGFIDTDNQLHTSGGSSGFGVGTVTNTSNLNYGYLNQGGTTKNNRAKGKFPNDDSVWYASRGGLGGCSYFGNGGFKPGYGGGGNGLYSGSGATGGAKGGAAFFSLIWDL